MAEKSSCPIDTPFDPMNELFLKAVAIVFRKYLHELQNASCPGCSSPFSLVNEPEDLLSVHSCMILYHKSNKIVKLHGTRALSHAAMDQKAIFESLAFLVNNPDSETICMLENVSAVKILNFFGNPKTNPFVLLTCTPKLLEKIASMAENLVFGTWGYQWRPASLDKI